MIWEQHTANIIMMTKLEEKSRVRSRGGGDATEESGTAKKRVGWRSRVADDDKKINNDALATITS